MAKVYIVTAGVYSSYRIVAAFSSKKLAEDYKKRLLDTNKWVEPYQVDVPVLISRTLYWHVKIGYDLQVSMVNTQIPEPDDNQMSIDHWGYLNIFTLAEDEQRAIKIAMEKTREYKADNKKAKHWHEWWVKYADN